MKRAGKSTRNQRQSTSRQRKQQHLLDVKVRSYKFNQQRNRKVVVGLCKVILGVALIAGVYYGGREGMNRLLWKNQDYNLTNIEINDDGSLSREQILAASGIVEGRNIFSVNLSNAREKLSQLPQVEHVELERLLPGKIAITISERKPIAWVTAKGSEDPSTSASSFLIDRKGIVVKSKRQLPEYFHLPVISGFSTDRIEAGQMVNAVEMKAALKLIDLDTDNTRFQIRSIDLSKGYCMVVTDQNHKQITFGLDRVEIQLERLGLLLDHVERTDRIIQTANLMVERNVPVTFAELPEDSGSSEPPEAQPVVKVKDKIPPGMKKPEAANSHLKPKTAPQAPVKKAISVKHAFGNG